MRRPPSEAASNEPAGASADMDANVKVEATTAAINELDPMPSRHPVRRFNSCGPAIRKRSTLTFRRPPGAQSDAARKDLSPANPLRGRPLSIECIFAPCGRPGKRPSVTAWGPQLPQSKEFLLCDHIATARV